MFKKKNQRWMKCGYSLLALNMLGISCNFVVINRDTESASRENECQRENECMSQSAQFCTWFLI